MPIAAKIRDHHGTDEIERRDDRTQQHHQGQQDDDEGRDDDESDVVLVVVARVPQRGGEPAHRYRGVGQCGVRLRALGGVTDLVDLIHRLGAERVEFGLHQVPHRVAVRRDERLGGLLEVRQTQHLGGNVEPRHRRVRRVVSHRQQKCRRLVSPAAISLICSTSWSTPPATCWLPPARRSAPCLQLGQAGLRATRFVQPHRVDRLGDVGECARSAWSPSR